MYSPVLFHLVPEQGSHAPDEVSQVPGCLEPDEVVCKDCLQISKRHGSFRKISSGGKGMEEKPVCLLTPR